MFRTRVNYSAMFLRKCQNDCELAQCKRLEFTLPAKHIISSNKSSGFMIPILSVIQTRMLYEAGEGTKSSGMGQDGRPLQETHPLLDTMDSLEMSINLTTFYFRLLLKTGAPRGNRSGRAGTHKHIQCRGRILTPGGNIATH